MKVHWIFAYEKVLRPVSPHMWLPQLFVEPSYGRLVCGSDVIMSSFFFFCFIQILVLFLSKGRNTVLASLFQKVRTHTALIFMILDFLRFSIKYKVKVTKAWKQIIIETIKASLWNKLWSRSLLSPSQTQRMRIWVDWDYWGTLTYISYPSKEVASYLLSRELLPHFSI